MKKPILVIFLIVLTQAAFAQTYKWAKSIGGSNEDAPAESITDGAGNLITTGYFFGTVDFDPGPNVKNLTSTGTVYSDAFVMKTDSSGNLIWVKQIGGKGAEKGISLARDASNNIYVAGYFSDTTDFDPGAGIYNLSSRYTTHFIPFLLKLNSSGDFAWAVKEENPFAIESVDISDTRISVRTDNSGNAYMAYNFKNNDVLFFNKYSSTGVKVWDNYFLAKTSSARVYFPSLSTDPSGNVLLAASFKGDVDFDPKGTGNIIWGPANSIFLAQLSNSTGSVNWLDRFGNCESVYSLATDASGNIIMGGAYTGPVDFDPGTGVYTLPGGSGLYGFILKLTNSGAFSWVHPYSTSYPYSICTDASSNIYVTGYFIYNVDFDPSLSNTFLNNPGANDVFILKLTSSGSFVWVKQIEGNSYEQGTSIAISSAGEIYTVGYYQSTTDFDFPKGNTLTSAGSKDIFIHKSVNCTAINKTVSISGSTLTANVSNATYQWVTCPGFIPVTNANAKTFTPSTSGSYAVVLNVNGCLDTSNCYTIFATDISNAHTKANPLISPNPFTDKLTLDMGKQYKNIHIEIRSVLGTTLYKGSFLNQKYIVINPELVRGTYFVSVIADGNNAKVFKVIKAE